MKRFAIAVVVLALGLWAISYSAVPENCSDSFFSTNITQGGDGKLFTRVFLGGTDTTYQADTTRNSYEMGDARRASIVYKIQHYNGLCVASNLDSCRGRLVYLWSNDELTWSRLDSSAAITDTLAHQDSLVIRPYKFLRVLGYPSRDNVAIDDTTGDGGSYDDVFINRYSFKIEPFVFRGKSQ